MPGDSLGPSAAYLLHLSLSSLVHEMTWLYIGAKPFLEPILTIANNPYNKFPGNHFPYYHIFKAQNVIEIVICDFPSKISRPQWWKLKAEYIET